MYKMDFHIHTSSSDGLLSPTEVVKRAKENSVSYLAITDHDTLSGLDIGIKCGKELGVTIIPGIELSTQYNNESIHLLGFFKDNNFNSSKLIVELDKIKNHRIIRAKEIIKKLKSEFNIAISFDDVLANGKDTIARPHIARAIIDAGYDYNIEYIFQNFIGKDCKAYVPTLKLSTEDGISLLKSYNALVFLAHPKLISNSKIDDFLKMDLDGIEAIYFQNTKAEEEKFINIAIENNLLISCGSDFHGNLKDDKKHGDIGSMTMPSIYLEKFLDALNIK
ncbi:PHP domain-containing protein [Clostridium botulinum]|uniref:PHP domain-containing protein n=1 Tax=Clostridium botulinum TaxID=1491 RepID=UPI000774DC74|nr:PHP domain-containing protein [Clostridium botulinum]MBN1049501.1 PHP domain-containing protein [Clostridium botulinum]NFE84613.1 PHP domain-containing protein [Clostridium botulinum]NFG37707.1 PHP domain-containing protein [Clostridium botulinum]NFN28740.1 PHP domain-containing protein [Clostridium botulinum]NFO01090.1 PHP domain-containing protein [Clostridium botulinum]